MTLEDAVAIVFDEFVDSLIAAGVDGGFSEETSRFIVLQTVKGSQKLAEVTGKSFAELIEMVSSPGGTTEAALDVLREDGFEQILKDRIDSLMNEVP